jgi:hypothetical protein
MLSDELFDAFREDVKDTVAPYLWTDDEVYRYMNGAYKMFVRLIGGVADFTSDITQIAVTTGEVNAEVSPLILKFREARLSSSGRKLDIINYSDLSSTGTSANADYGSIRSLFLNRTPGPVVAMIIGRQRKLVSWVQIPAEDDTVTLDIFRLPLVDITGPGQEFDDVGDEHHEHFLLWMKCMAYGKQDAETFDKGKSGDFREAFVNYTDLADAEAERARSKVRIVSYGG